MMRWLHAELPGRLEKPQATVNALYDLHALAEQQWQRCQLAGKSHLLPLMLARLQIWLAAYAQCEASIGHL